MTNDETNNILTVLVSKSFFLKIPQISSKGQIFRREANFLVHQQIQGK